MSTVRSADELREMVDLIENCDACQGNVLKIDELCVLHFAAREYNIDQIRAAFKDIDEHAGIIEQYEASKSRFEKRANNVFPDRRVWTRTKYKEITDGENIGWFTNKRRYRLSRGDVFHVDKYCPHFPKGPLVAYPMSYARRRAFSRPCSHCTTDLND